MNRRNAPKDWKPKAGDRVRLWRSRDMVAKVECIYPAVDTALILFDSGGHRVIAFNQLEPVR